jgi:hypothetical protein
MQVSSTARQIGERLYSAEARRKTALEALEVIDYMQHFSTCADDFGTLPTLFHDQDSLADAAAIVTKLLAVAEELKNARNLVGGDEGSAQGNLKHRKGAGGQVGVQAVCGSLDRAVLRLQQYSNLLENRVVARFDSASKLKMIPTMQARASRSLCGSCSSLPCPPYRSSVFPGLRPNP